MPLTAKDFRRIALGMAGAVEGAHMGHPDFRVNGRIFATLKHDLKDGMVVLTPEQQQRFLRDDDAFSAESGAWGRAGCTRVRLAAVDEERLGEAMTLAFQHISAKSAGAGTAGPSRAKKTAREKPALTIDAAIKVGAAMPDVEHTTTWGAPALKLRGKLVACQAINKSAEPNSLVVSVPAAERDELIEADPSVYYVTDHYVDWDLVLVRLSRIRPDALRDLLQAAWRFVDTKARRPRRSATAAPRARRAVKRRKS